MLIPVIVLELCPGQSSKGKNKQWAIIQKLGKVELWLLCTAHLLNEIYLPTKFHVDTSRFYVPEKNSGQTDRRTKRGLYAHPSGSIKNRVYHESFYH
jgi:hypothetical protein